MCVCFCTTLSVTVYTTECVSCSAILWCVASGLCLFVPSYSTLTSPLLRKLAMDAWCNAIPQYSVDTAPAHSIVLILGHMCMYTYMCTLLIVNNIQVQWLVLSLSLRLSVSSSLSSSLPFMPAHPPTLPASLPSLLPPSLPPSLLYNRFENRASLAHDLQFLANMPELCDVTFLVGGDRQPVCGVKAIMAARSR